MRDNHLLSLATALTTGLSLPLALATALSLPLPLLLLLPLLLGLALLLGSSSSLPLTTHLGTGLHNNCAVHLYILTRDFYPEGF